MDSLDHVPFDADQPAPPPRSPLSGLVAKLVAQSQETRRENERLRAELRAVLDDRNFIQRMAEVLRQRNGELAEQNAELRARQRRPGGPKG